MASVFLKRGKYWARIKGDKEPSKWSSVPTGETDRDAAVRFAEAAQRAIDKRNATPHGRATLHAWVARWMERRKLAVHDWRKEQGRLRTHVLPVIGGIEVGKITTKHIADLVRDLRFTKQLAPRTVRNVYSVITAVLRDAAVEGMIDVSPCTLTEAQMGPVVDKDREWRAGAIYTRDEAEQLISDPRIPLDRRVVYGLGLLAGLRIGEGAALRWRHYDPTTQPLGKLTVALAYSTTNSKTKGTKTEAVRIVPVHPSLAELLADWRAGWAVMFSREPLGEDLIVPLPPEVKRTTRTGERFRGWDYTGKRWREVDLPALDWSDDRPARSVYDTKSTFITLAIEDGADRDIIRDRVTHAKPRRDAFDGYDRGPHWVQTCHEVAKVRLRYLATSVRPDVQVGETAPLDGSGGGYRILNHERPCAPGAQQGHENSGPIRSSCDMALHDLAKAVAKGLLPPEGDP